MGSRGVIVVCARVVVVVCVCERESVRVRLRDCVHVCERE